ncbi:MAG: hypothetical protein HY858_02370 [Candidatus Solibacter usitatus]|nr:hypothetical protein [Candidatus Solibacter usitatus]
MFSRRSALVVAGVALIAFGGALALRRKSSQASAHELSQRVGIVPFENLSGDAALDWPERLIPFAVAGQLQGLPRVTAFSARTPGEAVAQGATVVVYGHITRHGGKVRVRHFIEDARSSAVTFSGEHASASIRWTAALNSVAESVSGAVRPGAKPGPLGIHNDKAAMLLAEGLASSDAASAGARFQAAAEADPACGWCWQAWAERAGRSGGSGAAAGVIALSRSKGKDLDGLSRARLDLLDANLRNDLRARVRALDALTKASQGDATAWGQLGEAHVALRQYGPAETALERAAGVEPERGEFWNLLAYARAYAGKYGPAAAALDQYSRLDPGSANPLDSRGEIAMMAGKFTEAARTLEAAYEKDRQFNGGAALEKAALSRWLNGEKKEAGDLAERFLKARAEQGDPFAELTRARWESLFGQSSQARRRLLLLAGAGKSPAAPVAASILALQLLAEGDHPGAVQAARTARALARAPGQAVFASMAAQAVDPGAPLVEEAALRVEMRSLGLTARGDWSAAADAWREALQGAHGGADSPHRELLALCLVMSGRAAEAKPLLAAQWPLLTAEQSLLYDFLIYPNLFYVRAELARSENKAAEAQRNYDLFMQHSGDRADRFGQQARARAASRL